MGEVGGFDDVAIAIAIATATATAVVTVLKIFSFFYFSLRAFLLFPQVNRVLQ